MTMKELYSLYYIEQEIEEYKEKISELQRLKKNKQVTEYIKLLEKEIDKKTQKSLEINKYIIECEDPQLRLIMFLRFIKLKSWHYIAFKIGGGNTDDSVRKRCKRYVEKNG